MQTTFKALADPVRQQILQLLKEKPLSAGEIAKQFDLTNATISYHLKTLKEADLIFETREKNFIYYHIKLSLFEELITWVSQFSNNKEQENEK